MFRCLRSANSVVSGGIWDKFELIQVVMVVLLTNKNEEGRRYSTQHFSHHIIIWDFFPDAQGQLTLQSVVGSGRGSNSSGILWLSSLPARMKDDPRKKALEC